MRPLAFVLLALVGSLILTNLLPLSYADSNLDTLLRIATQARDNINIQLSQLPTVPDEIGQLYKQGVAETDALAQSISQNDQSSSKEHFLSAMKIFKEINDKISSLTPATSEQTPQIDTLQLKSEINRMQKLGDRLETIATKNNVEIDFTKFNETMQDARQNLDAGNADKVNNDLKTANQFLLDVHQLLVDAAKKKTSDRAKDFTEKQIQRLSQVKETSSLQNVTRPFAPLIAPIPQITNESQPENIPDMIVKLKQVVSEGKIDEALKLIKLIEALQNTVTSSQIPITKTQNSIQPNNENVSEITNPVNNSTVTEQNNQTQLGAVNNENATQNVNAVNDTQHYIGNEHRFHEKRDNQTQLGAVNNENATQNNVNATQNANAGNDTQHHIENKKSYKGTNFENKYWKHIGTNNSED
jgi:hypothetical protein